jgi:phosphate-selective porin OprO/OprP
VKLFWFAALLGVATSAAAQETSSRFAGAPRIGSTDGWSLKPRGRIQYDIGDISAPAGPPSAANGFLSELRRARLGIEGTAPGRLSYVFELELADGIAEFQDATIAWAATPRVTLTAGHQNNFQSLEELTSDRFTSFIERAAFTDAFNFEYRLGLSTTYSHGPLIAQGGVFADNLLDIDEGDDQISVDGRVVYAPRLGGTQLHLGGSLHWRDNGDLLSRGVTTRYRQRPAIHATDVRFIGTPALAADREMHGGLEAAAIHGPFHIAAEAHWLRSDLAGGAADPTFFGGYVELGWFLTGESRGYRSGRWDRTRVRRPIEAGGPGAFQLNLRYDHLDLNSNGVVGGRQQGVQASLLWIATDYARLSLNFARLHYDDAAIPAAGGDRSYAVDVLGLRAQFDF